MINKSLNYIQKQCYVIVWSVEKLQKVSIQKLQGLWMAEFCVYQKIQCIIIIKSKFLKEQVARGLISNLTGTKVLILSNIPMLNTFFKYKMNARVSKLSLADDKFMAEMHLKLPGFI